MCVTNRKVNENQKKRLKRDKDQAVVSLKAAQCDVRALIKKLNQVKKERDALKNENHKLKKAYNDMADSLGEALAELELKK